MDRRQAKDFLKKYFVATKEVAEILEMNKSQVSAYRRKKRLPEPVGDLGGRPIWFRPEVERFKKEVYRPRTKEI